MATIAADTANVNHANDSTPTNSQLSAQSPNETVLKLPHPFLTEYTVAESKAPPGNWPLNFACYQLIQKDETTSTPTPAILECAQLYFSEPASLASSHLPLASDNSSWARARRSPRFLVAWEGAEAPSLAQAWLLFYLFFTLKPAEESIRLELEGSSAPALAQHLIDVRLALEHPVHALEKSSLPGDDLFSGHLTVIALRSTFWQGAGSPFGPRPVWCPSWPCPGMRESRGLEWLPPVPLEFTMTSASAGDAQNPERYLQSWHPLRPSKPPPGTIVYSRWIPHLKETFSMVALDWTNAQHLQLFHQWQNDPRVSQGWNETGTLEQHRQYLRNCHEDPHQLALLAKWDDCYFAYFEVYWAKEDRLGSYYEANQFDRGRHSLVGDVRFRGPHRVSAWWSSLMHYIFLDDVRTMCIVGEPKEGNSTVIMYDLIHGFAIEQLVDLPHKRSALVRCTRWRFFQLCPLADNDKVVGGLKVGLVPKL